MVRICVALKLIHDSGFTEVGISKRKQKSKKTRKHAFDQESKQEKKKKKKENTLSIKEKRKFQE